MTPCHRRVWYPSISTRALSARLLTTGYDALHNASVGRVSLRVGRLLLLKSDERTAWKNAMSGTCVDPRLVCAQ